MALQLHHSPSGNADKSFVGTFIKESIKTRYAVAHSPQEIESKQCAEETGIATFVINIPKSNSLQVYLKICVDCTGCPNDSKEHAIFHFETAITALTP